MWDYDKSVINSAHTFAEMEEKSLKQQAEKERNAREFFEGLNAPINNKLKSLLEETNRQNELLAKQLKEAQNSAREARKEAKEAKIMAWISFGVATIISVVSIIISIII